MISAELGALGVAARVLTSDEIFGEMYRAWNPGRPWKAGYDPEDVRSSTVLSDVAISGKRLSSLGLLITASSRSNLGPIGPMPPWRRSCAGCPLIRGSISRSMYPSKQRGGGPQMQRRLAYSMSRGKRSGVSDLDSEAKFQDVETLLGR